MALKLSNQARIELQQDLTTLAQWYFDNDSRINTTCGICYALSQLYAQTGRDGNAYGKMEALLLEAVSDDSLGKYTYTYEKWEDRAYMCLFLAEYLEGTIEMKSSDILRKAKEIKYD